MIGLWNVLNIYRVREALGGSEGFLQIDEGICQDVEK